MEKPEQTVSAEDLKKKIDDIIDETKIDLKESTSKFAVGSAVAGVAVSVLSYLVGRRRGRRRSS